MAKIPLIYEYLFYNFVVLSRSGCKIHKRICISYTYIIKFCDFLILYIFLLLTSFVHLFIHYFCFPFFYFFFQLIVFIYFLITSNSFATYGWCHPCWNIIFLLNLLISLSETTTASASVILSWSDVILGKQNINN